MKLTSRKSEQFSFSVRLATKMTFEGLSVKRDSYFYKYTEQKQSFISPVTRYYFSKTEKQISLHCTSIVVAEDRFSPQVLLALQMYSPVASLLMLVKFNHWLDIINSFAFNFDQVTVG